MAKRPELIIMSGELSGKRFEVSAAGLRLGRSSSNDIHISDGFLSRNHCLFECQGADGISVSDLASANGTYVNGEMVKDVPVALKVGDEVQIGETVIKVVGETPVATPSSNASAVPSKVDLGFNPTKEDQADQAGKSKTSGTVRVITVCVAAVLIAAIAAVLTCGDALFPQGKTRNTSSSQDAASEQIVSFYYEKIDADSTRIFRYCAELKDDGFLTVQFDDLPGENRHVPPAPKKVLPTDMEILTKIFSDEAWTNLPADFSNTASTGDNSLKSRRIKLIRKNSVKEARVENKLEPDGFPRLREKLETWVNNVLEVQSIQRSREELVKSSEHNEEIGDEKWGRRDVEYRNLSDAISYYTLAKMDLTSLGASSKDIDRIQKKIDEAEIELKKRYDLVRSEATRLRKIGDWEKAREEFAKIRELIPRRDDERHRDAENNLEIIEKHIWEIDGKGKRK